MFVYWAGRRSEKKRMGYAADFCPICRDFRPFGIERVDVKNHVYGISTGHGQTLGFVETCETCGFIHGVDLARFKDTQPKRTGSTAALLEATYPNAHADNAQRLLVEGDVWRRPHQIDTDVRRALLEEPFLLLANQTVRQGETQATPLTIGGILLAVGAPFLVAIVAPKTPLSSPLMGLLLFGGVLMVVWGLVQDSLARRRRSPQALLLKALRPLQPTVEELTGVLGDLKVRSLPVWQWHRPKRLFERLKAMEAAEEKGRSAKTWLAEN